MSFEPQRSARTGRMTGGVSAASKDIETLDLHVRVSKSDVDWTWCAMLFSCPPEAVVISGISHSKIRNPSSELGPATSSVCGSSGGATDDVN